jgi:hypothetical protein
MTTHLVLESEALKRHSLENGLERFVSCNHNTRTPERLDSGRKTKT